MTRIISITTTPARKGEIKPVLESLIVQGLPVCLWVPRKMERTGEVFGDWPDFFSLVNAQWVDDEGPLTKLLPALRAGYSQILTADDDMIYGKGWAAGLIDCAERHKDAAIVYRGRNVKRGNKYSRSEIVIGEESQVSFVTGVYGALYRREHFDPRIFTEWRECPSNDDVTISAHLRRRGVPIYVACPSPDVKPTDTTELAPLYPFNNQGATQNGIDLMMWKDSGIVRDDKWGVTDVVTMLENKDAFAFSRWGDGEWIALLGREPQGANCDGHNYFPDMGEALRDVLKRKPHYYMGLQQFALKACGDDSIYGWMQANGLDNSYWVESDIFHYAAQNGDWSWMKAFTDRNHIIVGAEHLRKLFPKALGFIAVPDKNCWIERESIAQELSRQLSTVPSWVAVGFCASMMSEVLIDEMVKKFPRNAYIDFGSVFDPLSGVKSRNYMRKGKAKLHDGSRIVCMATMPERLQTMEKVVATIAPQCDRMYIYLNWHKEVPFFLNGYTNVHCLLAGEGRDNPDKGPDGKFHWCDELPPCYMLTVDDDIGYPDDYVQTMIDGVDRYNRRAVCCLHGTVLHTWRGGEVSLCGKEYQRTAYSYRAGLQDDSLVNVPGTGTVAWHSGSVKIPSRIPGDIFPVDPRIANWLWMHSVPVVSLKRDVGYLEYWPVAAHINAIYSDPNKTRAGIEWLYGREHPWSLHAPDSKPLVYDADIMLGRWGRPTIEKKKAGIKGKIDAVILYRKTGSNEHLKMTVAGLKKHFKSLRNVVVVGDAPEISGVKHIPSKDAHGDKEVNMICKTLCACMSYRITDPFLLCSDDEVLVADVDAESYPLHSTTPRGSRIYQRRVENTQSAVSAQGWTWAYFDGHIPIVVWKDAYIEAMRKMPWDDSSVGVLCRTPYACLMASRGEPVKRTIDPKHTGQVAGGFVMSADCMSEAAPEIVIEPAVVVAEPARLGRRNIRRRGDRW